MHFLPYSSLVRVINSKQEKCRFKQEVVRCLRTLTGVYRYNVTF